MAIQYSSIQNRILTQLKNAKELRYSDLKPQKIPNDLFNYHLQHLVKKGLLIRSSKGYSLSPQGIKHVADPHVSNQDIVVTSLFKSNVITIVSRIKHGKIEILNQLRKSHPSYGKVGVMGGIIRKGEPTEAAATRKLKVETGLDAEFKLIGIERRIMYEDNELFSDVYFPILYTDVYTGTLIEQTEYGDNMWVSLTQAIKNETKDSYDSIESIATVLRSIKAGTIKKKPFFYKETIKIA